jgi:hypothetical protein
VRKEHLMLPLPTHEPLLEKLDPATLFYFLALKMGWSQSNPISHGFIKYLHRWVRPRGWPGGAHSLGREIQNCKDDTVGSVPCQGGIGVVGTQKRSLLGDLGRHLRRSNY